MSHVQLIKKYKVSENCFQGTENVICLTEEETLHLNGEYSAFNDKNYALQFFSGADTCCRIGICRKEIIQVKKLYLSSTRK